MGFEPNFLPKEKGLWLKSTTVTRIREGMHVSLGEHKKKSEKQSKRDSNTLLLLLCTFEVLFTLVCVSFRKRIILHPSLEGNEAFWWI